MAAALEIDLDDLRNDLAGFLDIDEVADVHAEPFDLIEVVQRSAV